MADILVKSLALAKLADRIAYMLAPRASFTHARSGLVALLLCAGGVAAAEPSGADPRFESIALRYVDFYLKSNPERATTLGDHRFDDRLTNYSGESIAKTMSSRLTV